MKLLKEENFSAKIEGKEVALFTLRNKNGCIAQFTNFGARWLSMWLPDRKNQWADVVLGFDTLDKYMYAKEKYYGAIVGRVCGRIGKGTFELNGATYHLANNDQFGKPIKNHLHGGFEGFSFKVWSGKSFLNNEGEESLKFTLLSKDGEEGYPGNLNVTVVYTLTNDNAMKIEYSAFTDRPTIVNLTNHAYFNLHSNHNKNVLDHFLYINAEKSVECNEELIPTGNIIDTKDTPLDFSTPLPIGSQIHQSFPGQLFQGKGYVVSYILNRSGEVLPLAATVEEKESGRVMQVYTNQPGLQFYSGWLFDGTDQGKEGFKYFTSSGFALEAQGFPDAPNHSNFPSITLIPEAEYQQTTLYRFLIK